MLESMMNRRNLEPCEDCKPRQMLDILGIPKILKSLGSSGDLRKTWEPLNFGTSGILGTLGSPGEPREPGYNVKTLRNCKLYGSWEFQRSWKVWDLWETWEPLEFSRILGTLGSPWELMGAWNPVKPSGSSCPEPSGTPGTPGTLSPRGFFSWSNPAVLLH